MEGLPIGNGRLAAMVWGNNDSDRLSLNHEWLWRGVNKNRDNEPAVDVVDKVRELLKEGDYFKATGLANLFLGGKGGISKIKGRVDAYQPAGDLIFSIDRSEFSERRLDMDKALVTVKRSYVNSVITSEFLVHPVYNNVVAMWKADKGCFSGKLCYNRPEDLNAKEKLTYSKNKIVYYCSFNKGMSFVTEVTVKTDGSLFEKDGLHIENATYVTAYINIGVGFDEESIYEEIKKYPIPDIKKNDLLSSHTEAFSKLFSRLELEVDIPRLKNPIEEIIEDAKKGRENPELMRLYFNYGRYMLISCSINGMLPANLQGKWNDRINPPWDSDYHFNINLEMNYWMTEAANISECSLALLRYAESFVEHGRKAAKDLYCCRGIYLPLQTDAWGRATPESYGYAVWIGAAPWIARHFWDYYRYGGDVDFLMNRAYPFFKEVALFYEDYLVKDEEGIYQIMPSQSPENTFKGTGLWPISIGISAAMDVQLAFDALSYAIDTAQILNIDNELRDKWKQMREMLPDFKIGSDGRLLEWNHEVEEDEPGHRHLSHLYGLFPSDLFNPIDRPLQYEASIKSLEYRLAHGGGYTGWSRAWTACLYARIGNSNKLWEHLYGLIRDFATVSLLDLHPPGVFQIDGNLGAVAAVLESFVQYWGGKVHLLRALPEAWSKKGRLKGIRVPGGHELSLEWVKGEITRLEIVFGYAEKIILADPDDFTKIAVYSGKKGNKLILDKIDFS